MVKKIVITSTKRKRIKKVIIRLSCIFMCILLAYAIIMVIMNIRLCRYTSKLGLKNMDVVREFNIDEDRYDKVIRTNIDGVGNKVLHREMVGGKIKELKDKIKPLIIEELVTKLLDNECDRFAKKSRIHNKVTKVVYDDNWFASSIRWSGVKIYRIDKRIKSIVNDIYDEAIYFPVVDMESNNGEYPFENTWNGARNYGGARKHEGTDIMFSKNKEDVVPIVSISDGKVEKKGWLKLGGYRVLIKSGSGVKFYYAHLSSYADGIEEGKSVYAGQLIGYMGSTGYGEEGTKGKFDVHLHFGMYYRDKKTKEEMGLNPYFLLKMLKNNKLSYK